MSEEIKLTCNECLASIEVNKSADRQWFALGIDGVLYALGDCGDFVIADEIAKDILPLDAIWIADYETARQWSDLLNAHLYLD